MASSAETNRPRSEDDSWMIIGRPTSLSAALSPSPSTMSIASSNVTFGAETASLRSISPSDSASLSDTETLDGVTVDGDDEVDSDVFTITSTPGGIPPRGSFNSKIIEVTVWLGTEARTFKIHKDVLCFYSPHFKTKLDGNDHIALPKVAPRIFAVFVHWIYTRDVPEGDEYDTSSSTGELCTRVLCELWVFGAKYKVLQLQKDMITKIVERVMHSAWKDPGMHIDYVYKHAPNSCLKELIMDLITFSRGAEKDKEETDGALEVDMAQPKDLALWDLRQYHFMAVEDMQKAD